MFISSETIRIVRLVARYQSITAAAVQIHKVPSAISYTVKKLEEQLGVDLFVRKGSYIELTPAGEYFVGHSKSVLDDLEALKRNTALVHEGIERELKIAANNIVPQAVLINMICQFETLFPSTQISMAREVYNGCWEALYSRRVDLVIGGPHVVPSSEGVISHSLGELDWDFVVGADHPLCQQPEPLPTNDLRQFAAICIRDTAINFHPQQAWLLNGQKPVYVPDFATAMALIQYNAGIGYVPRHLAAPLIAQGLLIKKELQEHKHATHLFLAHRTEGMGRARRWAVDWLLQPEIRPLLCGQNAPESAAVLPVQGSTV
ncbi:LysR substrate-binding domain-containing protein [Amantichitinum ursilacus]|uniref:HTH-type transcriptional activator AllS n=1 Tax=Amantichitinum ursilacus TaxID=857265 RepID=A0A0N0XIN3_9NEIS|nr:LysR substrate-binding domain-containing protein [Amantichitinum ursilacus]KPC50247.1 HTH-type transcriptional activator AllS [Amantichitinum ursilacus]